MKSDWINEFSTKHFKVDKFGIIKDDDNEFGSIHFTCRIMHSEQYIEATERNFKRS